MEYVDGSKNVLFCKYFSYLTGTDVKETFRLAQEPGRFFLLWLAVLTFSQSNGPYSSSTRSFLVVIVILCCCRDECIVISKWKNVG